MGVAELFDAVFAIRREQYAKAAIVNLKSPNAVKGVLHLCLTRAFTFLSAAAGKLPFTDSRDQVIIAGDLTIDERIGHTDIRFIMRVGAAGAGLAQFLSQAVPNGWIPVFRRY